MEGGDSLTEQGRGGRMPKDMGAIDGLSTLARRSARAAILVTVFELSGPSGAMVVKNVGAGHGRPVVFAIAEDGLAHLLRERKTGRGDDFCQPRAACHQASRYRPTSARPHRLPGVLSVPGARAQPDRVSR